MLINKFSKNIKTSLLTSCILCQINWLNEVKKKFGCQGTILACGKLGKLLSGQKMKDHCRQLSKF